MSYKLFLDDEREPVTDDWFIARTSTQAIEVVQTMGMPTFISFDHDLGGDDTAIKFINWMTDEAIDDYLRFPSDFDYDIHSQNPIGAGNIRSKMDQLLKHFKG